MHSHENILELLVQTYKADPNIRDNSGKRPKEYLKNSGSSQMNHLLLARKSISGSGDGFQRDSKIRQSNRSRAVSIMASSAWKPASLQASLDDGLDSSAESMHSLLRKSSRLSPRFARHAVRSDIYLSDDMNKMPPPSSLPPRMSQHRASSAENISRYEPMNRTSSDPSFTVMSKSALV